MIKCSETVVISCILNLHGVIGYLDSFALLSFVSAIQPRISSRADASVLVFLSQSSLNKLKVVDYDCEELCCVPGAVSERPSSVQSTVGVCMARVPEEESQNRV